MYVIMIGSPFSGPGINHETLFGKYLLSKNLQGTFTALFYLLYDEWILFYKEWSCYFSCKNNDSKIMKFAHYLAYIQNIAYCRRL